MLQTLPSNNKLNHKSVNKDDKHLLLLLLVGFQQDTDDSCLKSEASKIVALKSETNANIGSKSELIWTAGIIIKYDSRSGVGAVEANQVKREFKI